MRIYLLLSISLFIYSCQPKDLPTIQVISDSEISIKASHMTTKVELEEFSRKLADIGYNFDFSGCEFFEDGKLKKLSFIFILPNGKIATVRTDLMAIQYKYYGFTLQDDGYFKSGAFE